MGEVAKGISNIDNEELDHKQDWKEFLQNIECGRKYVKKTLIRCNKTKIT